MDCTTTQPWKEAADLGLRVFPCHFIRESGECSCGDRYCASVGKHPLLKDWQDDATTDEAELGRWWKINPKANVGIVTGNRLLVVDIDPRHNGNMSWQHFVKRHGTPPTTRTV